MAGWRFKRKAKSSAANEDFSVTLGDEWFSVTLGDVEGTIVVGIISNAGVPAARVISTEQAAAFSVAMSESIWADSMRGELPEGVISDE